MHLTGMDYRQFSRLEQTRAFTSAIPIAAAFFHQTDRKKILVTVPGENMAAVAYGTAFNSLYGCVSDKFDFIPRLHWMP